jgi:hypothetical protein
METSGQGRTPAPVRRCCCGRGGRSWERSSPKLTENYLPGPTISPGTRAAAVDCPPARSACTLAWAVYRATAGTAAEPIEPLWCPASHGAERSCRRRHRGPRRHGGRVGQPAGAAALCPATPNPLRARAPPSVVAHATRSSLSRKSPAGDRGGSAGCRRAGATKRSGSPRRSSHPLIAGVRAYRRRRRCDRQPPDHYYYLRCCFSPLPHHFPGLC